VRPKYRVRPLGLWHRRSRPIALTPPAVSAFPACLSFVSMRQNTGKSPPGTTARAYRNRGSSRPLSAASTSPVLTPRRSPVFLPDAIPSRVREASGNAGNRPPARSVIGLDAHPSQPIADQSDTTGRGTCQAEPERRETAFLFGGNAPPLAKRQDWKIA
jgi:hypothetical protein